MKKININVKYVLVSLALVVPLLFSSGCIFSEEWFIPPESEAPAPTVEVPLPAPLDTEQASPEPCNGSDPLPDFVAVVDKVKPSVVSIRTNQGAGSGWIIREDGLIVTNNHVVAGASEVAVILDDGRTFSAHEVRTDALTDLAVVKIDADNLPAAETGNCDLLQVGEPVAAIGNALGLGIRMTGGWISRLGVSVQVSAGQTLDNLIETDAAINPGNSGGPLVNMAGEVIGITSVKVSQIGVEGLGYAISVTTAREVIDQLILVGYVIRPYLGVGLSDVTPMVAFFNNLSVESGAFITSVADGSPADEAGLAEEDIIVAIDNQPITTGQDLINAIHTREIGQQVELSYWRGEEMDETVAVLIESPPPNN